MIRISDFYSLVKTFFKNIFSFKLSFEQQFKLFITKAFEILFRVYVKKVDDRFFHSNERKDRFKSKGFIKRTVTTAFGYVTFERRKYVDKKTGVCYYILFGRYYYRSRKRDKYSIFKKRRKIDKGSSEGNITKQNDLKKTAKNILLCYFGCPYIFYSVN